jgi:hypothetical protein
MRQQREASTSVAVAVQRDPSQPGEAEIEQDLDQGSVRIHARRRGCCGGARISATALLTLIE